MPPTVPRSVKFLAVGHVLPQAHWKMGPHVHHGLHELILVLRGVLRVQIAGQTLRASAGELLLYPDRQVHQEWAEGSDPLETLYMSFRSSPAQAGLAGWPLHGRDRQGRLEYLLRWMLDPAARQAGILDWLCRLAMCEYRQCLQAHPQADLAWAVRRYVREHLGGPISLGDLADHVGLSRYHLCRVLRRSLGATAMQLVRQMRVEAAQTLILRTHLPLKAVASQTGFASVYHFCRVFTRLTGASPGRLRRRHLG